jgi:hypothetical protein
MAISENDLDELADVISAAIEKARQLDMHTGVYILSMALVEVSMAAKAAANKSNGRKKPES